MIGRQGSLQVGQFGPDGVYGQVNLLNQQGSAHAWDVKIPGNPRGITYGDVMAPIVDQRAMAHVTKSYTLLGVTLPLWAWVAAGIVLYKVIK
jgi:hypothetical protein